MSLYKACNASGLLGLVGHLGLMLRTEHPQIDSELGKSLQLYLRKIKA